MKHLVCGLAIGLATLLSACGGGSSTPAAPPEAGASTLRISVTDAPFPSAFVEEASVVIREVRVRNRDTDSWDVVFTGSAEIDLVPLTGGVAALLVDASLPPGSYDEVRLIVDAGRVIVDDSVVTASGESEFTVDNGTLKFPSGAQTGIKVKIANAIDVTTGLSAELMLDFDLTKSFVFNGSPNSPQGVRSVLFKPVVRATNSSVAGSVQLTALSDLATPGDTTDDLPLEGATVRVCDDTDTEVATAMTNTSGVALLSLPAGTYSVKVEADAHDAVTQNDIVVVLANTTDVGVLTLALSETEITGTVSSDGATPADTSDDLPVGGATVEVRATGTTTLIDSTTTDGQGAFVLSALPPGDYDLRVIASGYTTLEVIAVTAMAPGASTPQSLILAALTRDVTGTVTDNAMAAAAGATVEIQDAAGTSLGTTTTDVTGAYTLVGIPTGNHTLLITPTGSLTAFSQALSVVGTAPVSNQTADVQLP